MQYYAYQQKQCLSFCTDSWNHLFPKMKNWHVICLNFVSRIYKKAIKDYILFPT